MSCHAGRSDEEQDRAAAHRPRLGLDLLLLDVQPIGWFTAVVVGVLLLVLVFRGERSRQHIFRCDRDIFQHLFFRLLHLQLAHGEELENPVLHVLEAEMVLVQDLLGLEQVDLVFRARAPRQLGHQLEVCPQHLVLGRLRVRPLQTPQLPLHLGAGFIIQLQFLDPLAQLLQFARLILVPKLALDRLHLLAQHDLPLLLAQLLLHLLLDLLLRLQTDQVALHAHEHAPHPLRHRHQLQQTLLLLRRHLQVERHHVGERAGVFHALGRSAPAPPAACRAVVRALPPAHEAHGPAL
jgi:hypothetical protein